MALQKHKTLDGQQIDELIYQAEANQELDAERKHRAAMADMAARAREFNKHG